MKIRAALLLTLWANGVEGQSQRFYATVPAGETRFSVSYLRRYRHRLWSLTDRLAIGLTYDPIRVRFINRDSQRAETLGAHLTAKF